jgi:MoxR-like ATPase
MSQTSPTWPSAVRDTIRRVNAVARDLKTRFAARDEAIDLLVLGAVCQENVLLVGSPGTAKTQLIWRFTELIAASGFHYLLTSFTEPTELFGPVDVEQFKLGHYRVQTKNMLPESQVVFLDELFRGSSPILNSLLTILNERVFYNGPVRVPVPLVLMIGATNEIPGDPSLQALADRFMLRADVQVVPEERLDELLDLGWELERDFIDATQRAADHEPPRKEAATVQIGDLVKLNGRLREVDLGPVRSDYAQVIRELRAEGIQLSDRRAVKGLKLVAGSALLRESTAAGAEDLGALEHIWSRPEEAKAIADVVRPRIATAGGPSGPAARSVEDILLDLDALMAHQPILRSDATTGAQLMDLGRLRRELHNHHPREVEARRKIEQAIGQVMVLLEPSHV